MARSNITKFFDPYRGGEYNRPPLFWKTRNISLLNKESLCFKNRLSLLVLTIIIKIALL
jgi:hypothetical protein